MTFHETLERRILVLDGAMGTMVQALGLSDDDFGGPAYSMLTDLVTFANPEALREIHLAYFRAGAMAVETNTFGASPFRLAEYDFDGLDAHRFTGIPEGLELRTLDTAAFSYHLSRRAAEVACEARDAYRNEPKYDGRPLFVLGSIGPSNRVVSSTDADLTPATFDEIAENFRQQTAGLLEGGVDAVLFETQQDILETKAGILGAQRAMAEAGRTVPIMCQVTVDAFSRMQIFNTGIHAAQVAIQGMGIATFGINCSIGPDLMAKTVETMARYSPLPISVVPNAGLPVSESGETVFKFPPDKTAAHLAEYVNEFGANVVGGCCGTTPEHIAAIVEAIGDRAPKSRAPDSRVYVSGPQEAVLVDSSQGIVRIGERLNVRGSKKVRKAVETGEDIDQDALEDVVHDQVHELGLNVIDVCMDSNIVNTARTLVDVVHRQTTDFPGAMCLDSFEVEALAEAVKAYPGRPIINSMSLEEVEPGVTKVDAVLRATAAHHPLYIGLAAGPEGPAAVAGDKAALAEQIVAKAAEYGVGPDQILVDMNVFPIGSESDESINFALESLEAIPRIKAIHPDLLTVCGIGNLTMGLARKPYMRTVLTSVWLDEARKRGLDAAIINPNHYVFVENLEKPHYGLALRVILEHDMDAFAELEGIADEKRGGRAKKRSTYDDLPLERAVCEKIKDGYKQREHGAVDVDGHSYRYADKIVLDVVRVIRTHNPLDFVGQHLMKAMNELGDAFGRGEVSLPHLLKSADVMKQVMGFLEEFMRVTAGIEVQSKLEHKGAIVLGTVYQDVHSIGKDLAKTLFENYGYRVIDLGVMTPLQQFLDAAKEHNADAIGMSALLVQTSNHMITVSQMMAEQGLADLPVLIGGAPVTKRHAAYVAMAGGTDVERMRPNVFYCATAMDGVNVMNALREPSEAAAFAETNRAELVRQFTRAEERAHVDEELLRTLPVREVSFEEHEFPTDPWLAYQTVRCGLKEFREHIDTKTLFALNWRFGGKVSREKQGETPEKLEALLDHWIDHADHQGWVTPMGVCGLFPCQADGDELIVYDAYDPESEVARFTFARVIGAGKEDTVCAAQYFYPKDSGKKDVVGLQITTSGPQVDAQLERFRRENNSEACLHLQGLSDRVAEDMAEYLHGMLRQQLGFDPGRGIRWSPGYPAMPDTANNRTLLELLHATDLINVTATGAGEFSPTGTTAAVVCFHSDARYT